MTHSSANPSKGPSFVSPYCQCHVLPCKVVSAYRNVDTVRATHPRGGAFSLGTSEDSACRFSAVCPPAHSQHYISKRSHPSPVLRCEEGQWSVEPQHCHLCHSHKHDISSVITRGMCPNSALCTLCPSPCLVTMQSPGASAVPMALCLPSAACGACWRRLLQSCILGLMSGKHLREQPCHPSRQLPLQVRVLRKFRPGASKVPVPRTATIDSCSGAHIMGCTERVAKSGVLGDFSDWRQVTGPASERGVYY